MDNVAIVGGGIGGLAAALALIRRGIDVDVYEQAPELRELGAGVQISANGTRVLHALGLKEALEKVQVLPAGKAIRLWNTGQSWKLFDLGLELVERYGFPYITIHRGDLHGVIAQAVLQAKPGAIHLEPQMRRAVANRRPRRAALRNRRAGQGQARGRRRRRAFGGARNIIWRGKTGILRHHCLARRHSDGAGAGLDLAQHRHQLGRPWRPRRALSAARRKTPQLCRHGRARLDRRRLERARHHRRSFDRFSRLACRRACADPQHRRAVQMGPSVAAAHGAMEQRSLHAARRRLPSHGAAVGPRRSHGARRRHRAGARTRKISARSPSRTGHATSWRAASAPTRSSPAPPP